MRVSDGLTSPSYTPPLTEPERRVAHLVARKWTTKRIAAELTISVRRVQVLITSIAVKTGVKSGEDDRVHVAVWWRDHHRMAAGD